ncbi:MAG TPA: lyase family protein [Actinomycetota bacterium]|nr:lyase family protein [Actinomycetota bacterium]
MGARLTDSVLSMGAHLTDSALYGHLWATDELRRVFDEGARVQGWLDVLATLAQAQAELGIIPEEAAKAIAAASSVELLDLGAVAEETRRTGHSTLGLIRGLQAVLPDEAREWVYYGATVQDLTDTWSALAAKKVLGVVWRDLRAIEETLLSLAEGQRDTLMAGRTHGQPGSPVTFGYKVAGWADELRRHLDRLREAGPRLFAGQLGGGVGTVAFFGPRGVELRRRFCDLLCLEDPAISWTSSRDRPAELVHLLAAGGSLEDIAATAGLDAADLLAPDAGAAGAMVDEVLRRARAARANEPEVWP